MTPSIMQVILIISGVLFALMAIDAYKREKITVIHFMIFGLGGLIVGWSVIDSTLLTKIAKLFGGRTAPTDIVVYLAIIFLTYGYFEILNKVVRLELQISELTSGIALEKTLGSTTKQTSPHPQKNEHITKSNILIIIPAYNEEGVIKQTINDLASQGRYNIVVVNDGSKDKTYQKLHEIHEQIPSLTILHHVLNRGYGGASKTGLNFALQQQTYPEVTWVITFDADGQMPVENLDRYLEAINTKQYDIVLGSRFIRGAQALNIPTTRRIILRGSRLVTGLLNNARVSDPHNGLRAISIEALKKFQLKDMGDHMSFASDFQDECARLQLRYIEIPTKILYTKYSLQKGQHGGGALRILKDVIYKKIFFR